MIGVVLGFIGAAAVVLGDRIFGIEPDDPLVVGDRPVIAFATAGAAVVVGGVYFG
jgi:hypothetical protein